MKKESEWDAGNVGSLVAVKECFCDSLLTTLQNVITVIWLILYIGHFNKPWGGFYNSCWNIYEELFHFFTKLKCHVGFYKMLMTSGDEGMLRSQTFKFLRSWKIVEVMYNWDIL